YRDYILDHYKHPRNFGELESRDLEAHEHNPLCGDEIGVHIRVSDERIEDLRFHGHGCAISQASASIASEELKGMPLQQVAQLRARQGISREVVAELSKVKDEPDWMADKRLRSLEIFERKPMPTWGVDLSGLNLDDLVLYSPPTAGRYNSWDEVPEEMKQTYEDLGIPQAEREHLAGVVGVWRQEPVYEGLKGEDRKLGILFWSMDTAVRGCPELVQRYFM